MTTPLLERLADLPLTSAPVDEIVLGGRAAIRRRRRTVLASGAAAVALVAGASALAAATTDRHDSRDGVVATPGPATTELTVRAFTPGDPDSEHLLDAVAGRAVWNEQAHTVMYGSTMSYSGSCPVEGRATIDATGSMALSIDQTLSNCTADARRALVVIQGVDHPPTTMKVTDGDQTFTLPVARWQGGDVIPMPASGGPVY